MVSRAASRDSGEDKNDSDLFKEAEEFIRDKMNNLMGLGYSCGVATNSKARSQRELSKVFGDDDIDKPIVLSWRMDPRQSMSDWVLVVKDGVQSNIYHVHKETLVYGERKSGFFVKLFEKIFEDGNPDQRNFTEVNLDSYTAHSMPLLLDYIYEDKLDLNASNAPGLRSVANRFDVRSLYALVSSFIQQDLSNSTVVTYIEEAEKSKDAELGTIAMQIAIRSFDMIADTDLCKIRPQIFQNIVSDQHLNVASPEILSQRIAAYMRLRDQDIDDESFFFLTHANILPTIHKDEAIFYLAFGSEKFPSVIEGDNDGGYEGTLLHRCVAGVAEDWKKFLSPIQHDIKRKKNGHSDTGQKRLFADGSDLDEMGYSYLSLPDHVKVEILQECLLKSSQEKKTAVFTKSHTYYPKAASNPVLELRSSTVSKMNQSSAPNNPDPDQSHDLRSDTPSRRDKRNGVRKNSITEFLDM